MTYTCCAPQTGGSWVARRYYTTDERVQWLEDYAEQLDNELKAVRERIARLTSD